MVWGFGLRVWGFTAWWFRAWGIEVIWVVSLRLSGVGSRQCLRMGRRDCNQDDTVGAG